MRQKNTKQMLNYWMNLYWASGNEAGQNNEPTWPSRDDIQPSQCRSILGNMFILERNGPNVNYRLAGTNLCSMYGRELKQETFAEAFVGEDQRSAESWTYRLGLDDYIVMICSLGETEFGDVVNLETLLLPLLHNDQPGNRILGITTPCETPSWLGATPVIGQSIRSVRILRPWEDAGAQFQPLDFAPPKDNLGSRRSDSHTPPMFVHQQQSLTEDAMNYDFSKIRQVKHLRIIDGGLA
ncbi:MAG: PAS domain-containing protein [Rhizobiaceae bacterium]